MLEAIAGLLSAAARRGRAGRAGADRDRLAAPPRAVLAAPGRPAAPGSRHVPAPVGPGQPGLRARPPTRPAPSWPSSPGSSAWAACWRRCPPGCPAARRTGSRSAGCCWPLRRAAARRALHRAGRQPAARSLTELVSGLVAARQIPAVLVAHELAAPRPSPTGWPSSTTGHPAGGPPAEVVLPASRRVAELVGYLGFVPLAGRSGRAAWWPEIHPERVAPGAHPDRGRGADRDRHRSGRPSGAGWEADLVGAADVGAAGCATGPAAGRSWRRHGPGPALLRGGRRAGPARPRGGGLAGRWRAQRAGAGGADGLRLARLARGFSQQQLAGMAGVSRQAVSAVESGLSDPSLRVALALAQRAGPDRGGAVRAGQPGAAGRRPAAGAARHGRGAGSCWPRSGTRWWRSRCPARGQPGRLPARRAGWARGRQGRRRRGRCGRSGRRGRCWSWPAATRRCR